MRRIESNPGARLDGALDLVVDSRKLILGFALLMVLCGGFFVFGFIEGKRQTVGAPARPESASRARVEEPAGKGTPAAAPAKGGEERSVRQQLDWYRSVKPSGDSAEAKPPASAPPRPESAPASSEPTARPAAASARVTYSVQVGAFRQRREAEAKGEALQAKGYHYTIDSRAEDGLFLLKVGRFDSRADAVALQLRLKKDGFATLIKTN